MIENLQKRFPGLKIAGSYSPPYGPFPSDENRKIVRMINDVSPDILWVGMTSPKQDKWMYKNFHNLHVPVMIGIGAAFDFVAGTVKRAPLWMQKNGLDWLYRFSQEPKRLWRRYLFGNSIFIYLIAKELIGKTLNRPCGFQREDLRCQR